MAKYLEDATYVQSPEDLEQEMQKHGCKTVEELDKLLWFTYGVALVLDYKNK